MWSHWRAIWIVGDPCEEEQKQKTHKQNSCRMNFNFFHFSSQQCIEDLMWVGIIIWRKCKNSTLFSLSLVRIGVVSDGSFIIYRKNKWSFKIFMVILRLCCPLRIHYQIVNRICRHKCRQLYIRDINGNIQMEMTSEVLENRQFSHLKCVLFTFSNDRIQMKWRKIQPDTESWIRFKFCDFESLALSGLNEISTVIQIVSELCSKYNKIPDVTSSMFIHSNNLSVFCCTQFTEHEWVWAIEHVICEIIWWIFMDPTRLGQNWNFAVFTSIEISAKDDSNLVHHSLLFVI